MASFLRVPCKKSKPTKKHRPAIWECMLGTVYAMDDKGIVKYFDYRHSEAILYAGASQERDPRLSRFTQNVSSHHKGGAEGPRNKQLVLWITQE